MKIRKYGLRYHVHGGVGSKFKWFFTRGGRDRSLRRTLRKYPYAIRVREG